MRGCAGKKQGAGIWDQSRAPELLGGPSTPSKVTLAHRDKHQCSSAKLWWNHIGSSTAGGHSGTAKREWIKKKKKKSTSRCLLTCSKSTVRLRRAVWLEGEQPSSQDAANTLHPQIYVTAFSQLHTPPTTPHQKNPQPNWSSF